MSEQAKLLQRFPLLAKVGNWPKPLQLGAAAAAIALIVVLILWSRAPGYRVLFSNLNDQDGGAIVTALGQMNVPYRFSDNGRAILVPADKLYRTRMQLASRGLPQSGEVGFELLDKTRFGASQFTEQITYQRALEGEISRTIEAMNPVRKARVHLAIPKQSLFVRDRETPTASVLVTLYPGRTLSRAQVSAMTWLVSSSVPNLPADHVSIVDENGHLLTSPDGAAGTDSNQRQLVSTIEQRTTQRILTILTPLVGAGNVRAQVNADVDFTQREQTAETYRPNQDPGEAAVRSKQISSSTQTNVAPPRGVPGALTNQPPANATAPIVNPARTANRGTANNRAGASNTDQAGATDQEQQNADDTTPRRDRHDATINYELDHTINHTKDPFGTLRRLSVAVVVNYHEGKDGKPEPLDPQTMDKIDSLVRQAMGYSSTRGDTVSVVNSPFTASTANSLPVWKDPYYISLAMQIGQYLLALIAILLIWRGVLRPVVGNFTASARATPDATAEDIAAAAQAQADEEKQKRAREINRYEDNLDVARTMASKDPRAVAMVMRTWMEKNGKH
jgi:flagellar M-ring protein FliF